MRVPMIALRDYPEVAELGQLPDLDGNPYGAGLNVVIEPTGAVRCLACADYIAQAEPGSWTEVVHTCAYTYRVDKSACVGPTPTGVYDTARVSAALAPFAVWFGLTDWGVAGDVIRPRGMTK